MVWEIIKNFALLPNLSATQFPLHLQRSKDFVEKVLQWSMGWFLVLKCTSSWISLKKKSSTISDYRPCMYLPNLGHWGHFLELMWIEGKRRRLDSWYLKQTWLVQRLHIVCHYYTPQSLLWLKRVWNMLTGSLFIRIGFAFGVEELDNWEVSDRQRFQLGCYL